MAVLNWDLVHKLLIGLLALSVLCGGAFAATKKRVVKARYTAGKTGASRTTPGKHTASSRSKKSSRATAQSRRGYQSAPTPERYKEIQQALAAKGYYKGEANGQWGADSVDALRRFQTDQKLQADGKIGALSLIALGLGPKRMTAQARPDQPAVPANQPDPVKKEQP